jgi:hypothetical protein
MSEHELIDRLQRIVKACAVKYLLTRNIFENPRFFAYPATGEGIPTHLIDAVLAEFEMLVEGDFMGDSPALQTLFFTLAIACILRRPDACHSAGIQDCLMNGLKISNLAQYVHNIQAALHTFVALDRVWSGPVAETGARILLQGTGKTRGGYQVLFLQYNDPLVIEERLGVRGKQVSMQRYTRGDVERIMTSALYSGRDVTLLTRDACGLLERSDLREIIRVSTESATLDLCLLNPDVARDEIEAEAIRKSEARLKGFAATISTAHVQAAIHFHNEGGLDLEILAIGQALYCADLGEDAFLCLHKNNPTWHHYSTLIRHLCPIATRDATVVSSVMPLS